jgi:hypothetical protein
MATLKVRIENLATRMGGEAKALRTLINNNLANLSGLNTVVKTNLVAAINELVTADAGKQANLGFTPENAANKSIANGYAGLDGTGKVPSSQLPAYVDDVIEGANLAAFPGSGSTGIIYVAIDTGFIYRWSGTAYVNISAAGSGGTTDSVTEGVNNLYFTSPRAVAALDPSLGAIDTDYVAVFNAALV